MQHNFHARVYYERRHRLAEDTPGGVIVLLGHDEAAINFADNHYPFRQDSSFLYFIGLAQPGLAAIIDAETGHVRLFGDDTPDEQLVWTGLLPKLSERAEGVGIEETAPLAALAEALDEARGAGRTIHLLPPYRAQTQLVRRQLGLPEEGHSAELVRAVVAQRSIKSPAEVDQIEAAIAVSAEMYAAAMRLTRPGMVEHEVVGQIEGMARAHGMQTAFPTIFSVHGEILHNHSYDNVMREGQIVVCDSGVETPLGYASDITRTIPVGGRFTERQREVYAIELRALEAALTMLRPGVEFRDVHRRAALEIVKGLGELGLMHGDAEEAVAAGAHTLVFPCGLGHMMGLDVHDMEGLGEDYVGYTDTITREPAFGWCSLRLARALEPGFVLTVEPGIYFVPELLRRWRAEGRCAEFVNYEAFEGYMDFGGVRVEEDVLITKEGYRLLGQPIPRSIEAVEAACEG